VRDISNVGCALFLLFLYGRAAKKLRVLFLAVWSSKSDCAASDVASGMDGDAGRGAAMT